MPKKISCMHQFFDYKMAHAMLTALKLASHPHQYTDMRVNFSLTNYILDKQSVTHSRP